VNNSGKNFIQWYLKNWLWILIASIIIEAAFQYALALPMDITISVMCGIVIVWVATTKIEDISKRRIFIVAVPLAILVILAILSPLLNSYNLFPALLADADANYPGLTTYKRIGRAIVIGLTGAPFIVFVNLVIFKVLSLFIGKSGQAQSIDDLRIKVEPIENDNKSTSF
jgi:hypothetical protein